MNKDTLRKEFKKFMKGVVFVDKNDYKIEIPIELVEDFLISKFVAYQASLVAAMEYEKPVIYNENKDRHLENVTKYNTLDLAISIIKNTTV